MGFQAAPDDPNLLKMKIRNFDAIPQDEALLYFSYKGVAGAKASPDTALSSYLSNGVSIQWCIYPMVYLSNGSPQNSSALELVGRTTHCCVPDTHLNDCSPTAVRSTLAMFLLLRASESAITHQELNRRPWYNRRSPREGTGSPFICQSELVFRQHVCQNGLQHNSNIKSSRTRLGARLAWPSSKFWDFCLGPRTR